MNRPSLAALAAGSTLVAACLLSPVSISAQGSAQLERGQAPPARPVPPPPAPSPADLAGPPADAERHSGGFSSKVLFAGKGDPPTATDIIAFHVIGRSPSGAVFQDSFSTGKPQRIQVRQSFPAWVAAMQTMRAGEVRRFWFPASALPKNPRSGALEPAIFDVWMMEVGRLPDPPKYLERADPKAKGTPYGAFILTTKKGSGEKPIRREDGALVGFTVWTADGKPANSSIAEGRPSLFPVEKVMPAFGDCLEGMTIGEKRTCWIPKDKNLGFPSAPREQALIFEIELINNLDYRKLFEGGKAEPPKN